MATHVIGIIGTGNMGSALARAICRTVPPQKVMLSNRTLAKAEVLARELGCAACTTVQVARQCHYILLAVKPNALGDVLQDIAPFLTSRRSDTFALVTMAPGISMQAVCDTVRLPYPVIRIMPNTPCAVGAGMILYDANPLVTPMELQGFLEAMTGTGTLDRIDERLMDAGAAISGCGPAFACQFLEALADGGVASGLPRQKALLYAAHTLEGTAKLLLETGEHPGQLKDAVCSPGGSTIQGVRVLEDRGLRTAVIEAVIASAEKNKAIGRH